MGGSGGHLHPVRLRATSHHDPNGDPHIVYHEATFSVRVLEESGFLWADNVVSSDGFGGDIAFGSAGTRHVVYFANSDEDLQNERR